MKKAYVVLKKGFEYDDNIYNESESGGGHPSLIVFNKKDAELKAQELNISELKEVCISNYGYEIDDILKVDKDVYDNFNKSLVEKYGEIKSQSRYNDTEFRLHPMADLTESIKYLNMIDISFYDVIETDIDLESFRNEKIDSILK